MVGGKTLMVLRMPILRENDMVKAHHQCINRRKNEITIRNCQRTAG